MIDLSIIIVNWNARNVLQVCLQSIIKYTKRYSYEIIVIDNNSTDNSVSMVSESFPSVVLIKNNINKGFAAANNQGLGICKGENILLLNPDTEITDPAIDKLVDFLKQSSFDIVTCKLLNSDGTLQRSVFRFRNVLRTFFENRVINIINLLSLDQNNYGWITKLWNHNEIRQIEWARGAVMLFPRYVLDKVGFLDERFFIFAEEIDYYLRANKIGCKAGFTPDISVIHHSGSSTKQVRVDMIIQNYKSYYLYVKKHHGLSGYLFYRIMVLSELWLKILKSYITGDKDDRILSKTLLKNHFSKDRL